MSEIDFGLDTAAVTDPGPPVTSTAIDLSLLGGLDDECSGAVVDADEITDEEVDAILPLPAPATFRAVQSGGNGAANAKRTSASTHRPAATSFNHLFFDIETVPDEERMHLFGLPEIPDFVEVPSADCPPVEEASEWTVDKIEQYLDRVNPEYLWLNRMIEFEQARGSGGPADKKKPRDGVFKALKKSLAARDAWIAANAKRRKDMSTSPEMCRIVAVGWALGNVTTRSLVVGGQANEFSSGQPITEAKILEVIWKLVSDVAPFPVVGWNILGFDLQVLRARSIILGVQPSRILSDAPAYANRDVIDLQVARFGRGIPPAGCGLKNVAGQYGLIPTCPGVDGSQTETLFRESPEKLTQYVESDVDLTRRLFHLWRGFWVE